MNTYRWFRSSIAGIFIGWGILLVSISVAALRVSISVAAVPATTQSGQKAIRWWDETRQSPPVHLHFVSVDLGDPRVEVGVYRSGDDPDGPGFWQTKLATVRVVAEREHLDVAVNGNFFFGKDRLWVVGRTTPYFPGNWACAVGWAMSDGKLWSSSGAPASLIVDKAGSIQIGRFDRVPSGAWQIVSGSQLLVAQGRNIASGTDAAPRTAAGIDRDGKRLVLLCVDGRRPAYSAGMTLPELADELIKMGCSAALNLDGGGSSTLGIRDPSSGKIRIANRPSDGHDLMIPLSLERPVADVLGIRCTTRPSG